MNTSPMLIYTSNSREQASLLQTCLNSSTTHFLHQKEESIEHLFFECSVSSAVWQKIQALCIIYRNSYLWSIQLSWLLSHRRQKSFTGDMIRLALAITVFHIGRYRNQVLYQGGSVFVPELIQSVIKEVQLATHAWRGVKRSKENWAIGNGMEFNTRFLIKLYLRMPYPYS